MNLPLIFLYIIPVILSIIVISNNSDGMTVGDLIGIVLISIIPVANIFTAYVGGLIALCQSKQVNKFLNKRIKWHV